MAANKDTTKEYINAFTEETASAAPAGWTTVGTNNAYACDSNRNWYGIGTTAQSLKVTGGGSIAHNWAADFAPNKSNGNGYYSLLLNFDQWAGDRAGIVFRAHDDGGTDKAYAFIVRNGNNIRLIELRDTAETVVAETSISSLSTDNWYKLEVYADGTTIKCRVWDVDAEDAPAWQIDTTDDSFDDTKTGIGVYGYIGSGNDCYFDHIEAREYTALPHPSPANLSEERENVWTSFKDVYVRWDGAVRKDKHQDGEEHVSEGVGYTLMEAVAHDDQSTFDLMWSFAKNNLLGSLNGEDWDYLIAWQFDITGGNIVADWNYASDADNDVLYALLAAHAKWGSAGSINYKVDADNMESDLYTYTINTQGTYKLQVPYPSELTATGDIDVNPSYFRPALFKILHSYYPATGWDTVLADGWTMINGVASSVGIVPNWYFYNTGTDVFSENTGKGADSDQHGYETVRVYPFFALASLTYGDADADTFIGGDLRTFFEGEIDDHSTIYTEYNYDGTDKGGPYEQSYFQYGYWHFLNIAGSDGAASFYSSKVGNQYAENTDDATVAYFGSSGYFGLTLNMINASLDDDAYEDVSLVVSPIEFDSSTSMDEGYPSENDTISHTVAAGDNPILIVTATALGNYPTGITYDGVAMTLLSEVAAGSINTAVYYTLSPTQGSAEDIVVTYAGSENISICAASYLNVDDIALKGAANGSTQWLVESAAIANDGGWMCMSVGSGFGTDTSQADARRVDASPNVWTQSIFDTNGPRNDGDTVRFFAKQGSSGGAGYVRVLYELVPATPHETAPIDTNAQTSIFGTLATANGTLNFPGTHTVRRGFVYDTVSRADPGDTEPSASAYAGFVQEGVDSEAAPVHVQRGSETMAASSVSTVVVALDKPVEVGKAFPIVTCASNITNPSRTMATATLGTVVDGYYTTLTLQRSFTTSSDGQYEWQVLDCEDFTVQTGELASGTADTDDTISTIDQSETFVVGSFRSNQTSASAAFPRFYFTSNTNVRVSVNSAGASNVFRYYVVSWAGATVTSGETTQGLGEGLQDVDISSIGLSNVNEAFIFSSFMTINGTQPGFVFTRVFFNDASTLRMFRWFNGASSSHTWNWFIVEHPHITVQHDTGESMDNLTNVTLAISEVDMGRAFSPAQMHGNSTNSITTSGTLNLGYTTHQIDDVDEIGFARGSSDAAETHWATSSVAEDTLPLFEAEPFEIGLSALTEETTYYVRAFALIEGVYVYGEEIEFETAAASGDTQRTSAVPILAMM